MSQENDTKPANGSIAPPNVLSGYEQFSMVSDQFFPPSRPTEIPDREEAGDPFEVISNE
jgi:hypothetical protein